MIKQEFIIDKYFWKVYVYYDVNDSNIEEIMYKLHKIHLPKSYITSAYTILEENKVNYGFTFTNNKDKTSIIVITKTSNASQFLNSFSHEIFHLVNHIARHYNISFDSEEVCYLSGTIAQKMFQKCHHLLCDECRNT